MGTTGRYPSLVLGIQHDAINAPQRPSSSTTLERAATGQPFNRM
jgi:hypothetical protein